MKGKKKDTYGLPYKPKDLSLIPGIHTGRRTKSLRLPTDFHTHLYTLT